MKPAIWPTYLLMQSIGSACLNRRLGSLVPYGACFVAVWALIGLESSIRAGEVAAALALQLIVAVGLWWRDRWQDSSAATLLGMALFLASVMLLRDGVGRVAGGYGSLVLLPVVWAALRDRRRELGLAVAGAIVVEFAPQILIGGTRYPASGWRTGALLIVVAAVLGATVQALVRRVRTSEAEHRALSEIARLVASGEGPAGVFNVVAEQLARLFDAALGTVVRFDSATHTGTRLGIWSTPGSEILDDVFDLGGPTAVAHVYRSGTTARVDYAAGTPVRAVEREQLRGAAAAPITVSGQLWGAVAAAFADGPAPVGIEPRLARFADLVALAISNAEAHAALARQAATDSVTGLSNHRAFHERLSEEIDRAHRYGQQLSVAVIDIDHFKRVNDTYGHQTGDRVLADVARLIASQARTVDIVGRIGGEEFAWLMPETDAAGAWVAADRARRAIEAQRALPTGTLTVSAGVCGASTTVTADELMRRADEALYEAKAAGRNRTVGEGQSVAQVG
jgi:diguanylate cyclase (GGDEF)-like protein